jgi:uncharacterized damage-inducible protein DinB
MQAFSPACGDARRTALGEVERLYDQLRRSYEGDAWHGPSLKELLKGVIADQAARRPVAGAHTIWELVNHIAAWEGIATRRLRGEACANVPPEQDWPPAGEPSQAAWEQALEHLDRTHRELEKRVRALPEERLTGLVTGHKYSVYVMLHGVVQHNLYHAGQIALLKKA